MYLQACILLLFTGANAVKFDKEMYDTFTTEIRRRFGIVKIKH